MSRTTLGLGLFAALAFAVPAISQAADVTYNATLAGTSEVPATTSAGKGTAQIVLDTVSKKIAYTVTYSGLSGPATAGHIHGPAAAGANAGVLVPFPNTASGNNPISGTAQLTDAQVADLDAGKMYVNLHTAANPGGEIRGQLAK